MQQSVIVHREKISRAGEIKYFQIPLPGIEKKIIAVETSAFYIPAGAQPINMGGSVVIPDSVDIGGGGGGDQVPIDTSGGGGTPPPPPPPAPVYDPLFTITANVKTGVLSIQSPDKTDIFYQGEVYRSDKNLTFGDFTSKNFLEIEQWVTGKKRVASEVSITTSSPMIEAYYKDIVGVLNNSDLVYQLNIFIWLEK